MNGRILELVKNPDLFQINDLELLTSEINKHPYIQSLRALHLLGTHRLQPENYANELSVTAAYTTDKKIIYQLINAVEDAKPFLESVTQVSVAKENNTEPLNKFTAIKAKTTETPAAVYVNGALNRILFKGEEDFLERETETIDLESTLESGQLVILKTEEATHQRNETAIAEAKKAENSGKENFIKNEEIVAEKSIVEDSSKLSFHATAEFLPDVKFTSSSPEELVNEVAKPPLNKHEEEMKRLIAEVEAKMKASKKDKTLPEAKEDFSKIAEVNFSETQTFDLTKTENSNEKTVELEKTAATKIIEKQDPLIEQNTIKLPILIPEITVEIKTESAPEDKPVWKPMSFATHIPDALIGEKTKETSPLKEAVQFKETIGKTEEKPETGQDAELTNRPVFNVSFFTQSVSALEKPNKVEEITPDQTGQIPAETLEESNVPTFINTWQSWLKIDRNKEEVKEKIEISITEIKNKVIENFIEKEPKISKLKEESDFVIKERNDDISHLMTETLANLYIQQKLYAKAIRAYGVLSEKHPEKKSYFEAKINLIKELRQNK